MTEDKRIPVTTKNLKIKNECEKKKMFQMMKIVDPCTYWLKKPSKPLPLRVEISPR